MTRLIGVLGILTLCCEVPMFDDDDDGDNDGFMDESELVETGATGGEEIDLGWSSSGPLTIGDTDGAVQLQANFPEPGNYTVQFTVQADNLAAIAALPIAKITWSVEGNEVTRTVSVTNGLSVSGSGQGVRVVVRDGCFPGAVVDEYIVSVQVVKGLRPTTQQPPSYCPLITDPYGITRPGALQVPASSNVWIDIPQSIGAISFFLEATAVNPLTPIINGDSVVGQYGLGGAVLLRESDVTNVQWIPLAPLASRMLVQNRKVATAMFYSINFGIDG